MGKGRINKSQALFEYLIKNQLIALLTPQSVDECNAAYEVLNPKGIVLEITFRSEYAEDGIMAILKKYPDASILAGTVMTREQAEKAVATGAAGIVSADYIPDVVEVCVNKDIMCIPGGLSDAGKQLTQKAKLYGCQLEELKLKYPYQWIYKLFPAISGSRSNVDLAKAWHGPYKDLTVIYTGGITIENLPTILDKDPQGIVCSSELAKIALDSTKNSDIETWLNLVHGKDAVESPAKVVSSSETTVVTFGEIMLRLSPPDHQRFIQTQSYEATYGGAEANTAVAIANFGLNSRLVTILPEHDLGQGAVNTLRCYGVDTGFIQRAGNRIGIYFLEHGASQRPSKVIYDRKGSSICSVRPGQFNWEAIFEGAGWFHWTGITPALGDNVAEATEEALSIAKKMGLTISVDLNYRKKLWGRDKASRIMTDLMQYVDIAVGNEEDAEMFFGIKAGGTEVESGQLDEAAYQDVARQLVDRFKLRKAALTLRQSISASDNIWSACLFNGEKFLTSRKYPIHIVERVGGGDAFSSGLIYGLITGMSDKEALEFATAASCLKQTIRGDFNLVTVSEVMALVEGKTGGRVQR